MMTKDELISKQQLQLENYKELLEQNKVIIQNISSMFYSIGAPLNDNILQFNQKQLIWCAKVMNKIEELNVS